MIKGPWIAICVALSIILMLIGGVTLMYNTRGFWGLEHNTNANTMNNTLNSISNVSVLLVTIVLGIAIILGLSVRRAF